MRVVVTAGGTGGHIYPALSILKKIKEEEKNSQFLYIGTHNRMEKDVVPKEGYDYVGLEIYGFSKKEIIRDIKNIFLINKAYKECLKILKKFKPDVVLGFGGYVTYPVIKAAKKLGIKTFIHEQNAMPGKSNKMLSKYADIIGVSFKESEKYFDKDKVIFTGNPCSENALTIKPNSKTKYGLSKNKKAILCVQGSLGSAVMNNKMIDFLSNIDNENYEVLYITGKTSYEKFKEYKFSKNVFVVPYVENLSALMKDMDVIVSRAGASIISEIVALGVPTIFIPSPYVANNHQLYNALDLKNNNAGLMIEEKDLNKDVLKENINKLLKDELLYHSMKVNARKMSVDNSSTIIYETIKK